MRKEEVIARLEGEETKEISKDEPEEAEFKQEKVEEIKPDLLVAESNPE